jgi:hypothetical protein
MEELLKLKTKKHTTMKKILYSVMALAIAALTFTSCEDVPEPYPTPNGGGGNATGTLPYTSANLNTGWTLQEVTAGAQPWSKGNSYSQATGYQTWDGASSKSNKAVEGWLVSPAISTVGYENVKLSFNHTIRYTNNVTGWEAYHKIYASTSFDGTNASTATWKELNFKPVASPYSDWTLYTSGEIQLPAEFVGKEAVYIGFWFKAPANASTTWEVQAFKMEEGIAENTPEPEPTPTEDLGTAEAPITVAKALEIIDGYEAAGESKTDAYVKGKIVSVDNYNSTYKSITYYISDDGTATKQLQIYSGKGLNGADFASKSDLNPGATVVVKGKLKKFVKNDVVTPEINQSSSIISIEGNEGGGNTPTPQPGGNTIEAGKYFFVYSASGSTQVGKPIEAGKDYGYMYLTDAKISDGTLAEDPDNLFTFTETTGGFTIQDASGRYYYMDDSHSSFQVSATLPSTNYVWTVSVADDGKATVTNTSTGKIIQYLAKYKEFTPTASGDGLPQLMKVGDKVEGSNEGGGGNEGGGEVSGTTLTVVFGDLGITDVNNAITLSDGTTLTFSQEDGRNAPIYHESTKIIRMYAHNSVTIKATKKIASLVFNYDTYQGTAYKGNDAMYGEVGSSKITPTKDDKTVTFSNVNNTTIKVVNDFEANSGGTQFRCSGLVINYAE